MRDDMKTLRKLRSVMSEDGMMYGNYVIRNVATNVTASFSIEDTGIHWSTDDEATIRDLWDRRYITCIPRPTAMNEQYSNFEIQVL